MWDLHCQRTWSHPEISGADVHSLRFLGLQHAFHWRLSEENNRRDYNPSWVPRAPNSQASGHRVLSADSWWRILSLGSRHLVWISWNYTNCFSLQARQSSHSLLSLTLFPYGGFHFAWIVPDTLGAQILRWTGFGRRFFWCPRILCPLLGVPGKSSQASAWDPRLLISLRLLGYDCQSRIYFLQAHDLDYVGSIISLCLKYCPSASKLNS